MNFVIRYHDGKGKRRTYYCGAKDADSALQKLARNRAAYLDEIQRCSNITVNPRE